MSKVLGASISTITMDTIGEVKEMDDEKTQLYCPYCGLRGLIRWASWDCPNGYNWYNCEDTGCYGHDGFYISHKA